MSLVGYWLFFVDLRTVRAFFINYNEENKFHYSKFDHKTFEHLMNSYQYINQ